MNRLIKTNIFFLLLSLSIIGCKKKPSANPIEDLPPITQTGANTFGCLINGAVFVPKKKTGDISGPPFQCYYQYLNDDFSPIKGYFFGLSAKDFTREPKYSLNINTTNKAITLGEFDLEPEGTEETAMGEFWKFPKNSMEIKYSISPANKGKLKITRFDEVNQIVSGTFWFDAINEKGEKVEVREGRFDMQFTR